MSKDNFRKSPSIDEQVFYWTKQLTDLPPILQLPYDYPRPPVQSFFRSKESVEIEESTYTNLKDFCFSRSITPFVALLVSFQMLLRRYTSQGDIIVGTVVTDSIRYKDDLQPQEFTNLLALRVREGNPLVNEFVQSVNQVVEDALNNRDYPFADLVKQITQDYNVNRAEIFQTMMVFIGSSIEHSSLSRVMRDVEEQLARCDLVITALEENNKLRLECEYDTDLFMPITIQRMLHHLQLIINGVMVNPYQPLSCLPLLSDVELHHLLYEWNNTDSDYPKSICVHRLFEMQCERTPDAIAVIFGKESLSYKELNHRANRLAHYLCELGVGTETLVGVMIERSLDMLVGLLGILKSGAAYVPFDPSFPIDRLNYIQNDTQIQFLLTSQRSDPHLSISHLCVIHLDADEPKIVNYGENNLEIRVESDNLIYVIYTSGSTGKPKGVQIEHRAVTNLLYSMQQQLNLAKRDTLLAITTLSFDISALEIFLPLITGACLMIAKEEEILNGSGLLEHLDNDGITIMQGTPAIWRHLLDAGWLNRYKLKILCGGETLTRELANQLIERSDSLWNVYGPTETTIWSSIGLVTLSEEPVFIGSPIANTRIYLLDSYMQLVPVGIPGEIHIGGEGLARGYLNSPNLTAEKFIPDPFSGKPGFRLYKTGDLARYRSDGTIEFLGRMDYQVKIRGRRIELGEIETVLTQHPAVKEAIIVVREDIPEEKQLVGYVVPRLGHTISTSQIINYLRNVLPGYMIPNNFVIMNSLPLSQSKKVNRSALPDPENRPIISEGAFISPGSSIEENIAKIWQEILGIEKVSRNGNFFDLGGHSLLLARVYSELQQLYHIEFNIIDLFKYPTVHTLAQRLAQEDRSLPNRGDSISINNSVNNGSEIAIIGMAGRFPGARNLTAFWHNLKNGIESISSFSDQDLLSSGIDPAILKNPNYVNASAVLDDYDHFDAEFFGFSPREAEITDPQHRILLECAWEAFENAGYEPKQYPGRIGVFTGSSMNTYLLRIIASNPDMFETVNNLSFMIGNDKDFLSSRISYKLNLKGPSVVVQTACSTSLVAIHMACRSLLADECEMALAGGVSIRVPHKAGYLFQVGSIYSPDGHCRAFDADAKGTVFGNGVGLVVLKRLADALRDGDAIHAIIKGSAINNDGSEKVGYTAPSIDGQTRVIQTAHIIAKTPPSTITYVETHGTGTPIGDPIEIAALTQAFRSETQNKGFCAIGSVKTNIGHLDAAAGVAGVIKTVLALENQMLPASLNFEKPNPKIDFLNSPFYVNTTLKEWATNGLPRRAGVSSLGIGGTNAHLVLEEAPSHNASGHSMPYQLFTISARSDRALEAATLNLIDYLGSHTDISLPDVAYTLIIGRQTFNFRRMVVAQNITDLIAKLRDELRRSEIYYSEVTDRPVAFLFPGQGAQYSEMTWELYQSEQTFREYVDICADLIRQHLGLDIREILYPEYKGAATSYSIDQTLFAQTALFTVEYALAQLYSSWGVTPKAMIGHSIGEYVAACLSGVLSLDDALLLVVTRGRLMQSLPPGSMLAVYLSESETQHLIGEQSSLSLAAVNAPSLCVISGTNESIDQLQERFLRDKITFRRLRVSHAFHSAMMDSILYPFLDVISKFKLHTPKIPYISNVTGTWIKPDEAVNPTYWTQHLRQTVRFADGLKTVCLDSKPILLEVGPGKTLSAMAKQQTVQDMDQVVLSSIRSVHESGSDVEYLLNTLGQLWLAGAKINGSGIYAKERRCRVHLPAYPFDRQRYWMIDPQSSVNVSESSPLVPAQMDSTIPSTLKAQYLRPNLKNIYIAPQSKLEEHLAILWQRALGINQVGIDDNFFELGGDSLTAVGLVQKIREQLQTELTLATFFENATIRQLAMRLYPGTEVSNV